MGQMRGRSPPRHDRLHAQRLDGNGDVAARHGQFAAQADPVRGGRWMESGDGNADAEFSGRARGIAIFIRARARLSDITCIR